MPDRSSNQDELSSAKSSTTEADRNVPSLPRISRLKPEDVFERLGEAIIRPSEIRAKLVNVVGQDVGKDYLSVLFSLHLIRAQSYKPKSTGLPSAIIVGPTGVGKTHSIRTIAALYRLPFVSVDSTTLVEAGIVGQHPEQIAEILVSEAESILKDAQATATREAVLHLAERGIVFFDEVDKLAVRDSPKGDQRDGVRTQRRLLKFIEGDLVRVGLKTGYASTHKDEYLNTANMLVMVGGAFAGIDSNEIKAKRKLQSMSRGGTDQAVTTEDIINYGFMPELVGRLPVIIPFTALSEGDLAEILLNEDVSPFSVWREPLSDLGIELIIGEEVVPILAGRATAMGMGARGLQQVVFPLLAVRTIDADRQGLREVRLDSSDFRRDTRISRLAVAVPDEESTGVEGMASD